MKRQGTARSQIPAFNNWVAAASTTYGYLANASLISNIVFRSGGTTRMTTTKAYDGLNRLASISSQPSAGAPLSYAYGYNAASQRTNLVMADSSRWQYQYDLLGQVTSGKRYWKRWGQT